MTEKLKKIVEEHPDLPIYYFCDVDDLNSGFNYQIEVCDVSVGYISHYNGRVFDNKIDFEEYITDYIYDREECYFSPDHEIKRIIESQKWEHSILVYFRPV